MNLQNERTPAVGAARGSRMQTQGYGLRANTSRYQLTARPLPPNGRDVVNAIQRGLNPNVWLFVGPGAWDRAMNRHRPAHGVFAMVLPDHDRVGEYRWPRVPAITLHCEIFAGFAGFAAGDVLKIAREIADQGIGLVVVLGIGRLPAFVRGGAA